MKPIDLKQALILPLKGKAVCRAMTTDRVFGSKLIDSERFAVVVGDERTDSGKFVRVVCAFNDRYFSEQRYLYIGNTMDNKDYFVSLPEKVDFIVDGKHQEEYCGKSHPAIAALIWETGIPGFEKERFPEPGEHKWDKSLFTGKLKAVDKLKVGGGMIEYEESWTRAYDTSDAYGDGPNKDVERFLGRMFAGIRAEINEVLVSLKLFY